MMTAKRSTLAAAVMIFGGLLAVPAPAQDSDSGRLNAILACNRIDKKSARLACYDAQAEGAPARSYAPAPASPPRDAVAAPSAPAAAYAPAPAAAAAPAPSFGSETLNSDRRSRSRSRKEARVAKALEAHAVSAVDDGVGRYTIALDDGARWKMTESQSGFAPPRAGDEVRIRKGALGSYLMDVNKQGSVRVVRIQ
jgi:hypothetical protein